MHHRPSVVNRNVTTPDLTVVSTNGPNVRLDIIIFIINKIVVSKTLSFLRFYTSSQDSLEQSLILGMVLSPANT